MNVTQKELFPYLTVILFLFKKIAPVYNLTDMCSVRLSESQQGKVKPVLTGAVKTKLIADLFNLWWGYFS